MIEIEELLMISGLADRRDPLDRRTKINLGHIYYHKTTIYHVLAFVWLHCFVLLLTISVLGIHNVRQYTIGKMLYK